MGYWSCPICGGSNRLNDFTGTGLHCGIEYGADSTGARVVLRVLDSNELIRSCESMREVPVDEQTPRIEPGRVNHFRRKGDEL